MDTQVNPIPQGYHSLTPYLIVKDAAKAIEFYKKAFGAEEKFRMDAPQGKIGHCELQIGDSRIMLADEFPKMGSTAPTEGVNSFSLLLYVDKVDEIFQQAIDAGAKVVRPLANEFYGDRMGTLEDPFGHHWSLATHVENVSDSEIRERAKKMWS